MRNLFGLVLVLCFVGIVPAQDREIDKAEFDSVVASGSNHRAIWKGEKYRMTVTTSAKAVGRPQTDMSSRLIVEYGAGDETRSITSSTFGDKTYPTNEGLRIGPWVYSRVDSGPWKKKAYVAPEPGKDKTEIAIELSSIAAYTYLGTGSLMGKPVRIYVKTETQTRLYKDRGETSEIVRKITHWIDENGTVVKSEYASEGRGPRIQTQTVVTTVWELDPLLSFSVPEIVP